MTASEMWNQFLHTGLIVIVAYCLFSVTNLTNQARSFTKDDIQSFITNAVKDVANEVPDTINESLKKSKENIKSVVAEAVTETMRQLPDAINESLGKSRGNIKSVVAEAVTETMGQLPDTINKSLEASRENIKAIVSDALDRALGEGKTVQQAVEIAVTNSLENFRTHAGFIGRLVAGTNRQNNDEVGLGDVVSEVVAHPVASAQEIGRIIQQGGPLSTEETREMSENMFADCDDLEELFN